MFTICALLISGWFIMESKTIGGLLLALLLAIFSVFAINNLVPFTRL